MSSDVTNTNDTTDGLHILEAKQSEEEMLYTQHTLNVSQENTD